MWILSWKLSSFPGKSGLDTILDNGPDRTPDRCRKLYLQLCCICATFIVNMKQGYRYGNVWTILPKDDIKAQWAGLYVSMNRLGSIVINRAAHERMDSPTAFHVMFDKVNSRIGLKPTALAMKHAYPARKQGRRGARIIRANRLLKEFGLKIPDTLEFPDAEIDGNGMLIIDLRTARVSPKAHSQCRRKVGNATE